MKNKYIDLAYKEALKAYKCDEVPVGAVIVLNGKVIAKAYNKKVSSNDVCAHAEILAIKKASAKLKDWRLVDCEMYVTLEPCPMCAGAILNSRIRKVFIGTQEPRSGAAGSKINLFENYNYNHKVEYEVGILESECKEIIQLFFKRLRNKSK